MKKELEYIKVRGARENNLKNISVDIPRDQLVVITGLSGSGKSSLAFDTVYAEGQRRYVESLSSYARQFLQLQNKPDVDSISGLSPAIAIDQKTTSKNPRSTVGTITEIYDYLRLLYARVGVPYSPATGLPITSQTVSQMVDEIMAIPSGTKVYILAPIVRGEKGEHKKEILAFKKQGYERVYIDSIVYEISDLPSIDKNKKHNIEIIVDRLVISEGLGNRLSEAIESALKISNGLVYVEIVEAVNNKDSNYKNEERIVFSERYSCPVSGFQLEDIEPRMFSFNSPFGACPVCEGIGREKRVSEDLIVPDTSLSIEQGAFAPWDPKTKHFVAITSALAREYHFSLKAPYATLPDNVKKILLYGSGKAKVKITIKSTFGSEVFDHPFEGFIEGLKNKIKSSDVSSKEELEKLYTVVVNCDSCEGHRLKKESLCVKINQLNIGEVSNKTIIECKSWFDELPKFLTQTQLTIGERVLKEITERLTFLVNVGLDYLTLSRESGSLSGGESQRIRLASQIGSGLSGVLYVLDEPSIGLHQSDNTKLIGTLKRLRDLGNTVVVVEHDEETIEEADYLIDVGPGAGILGGNIVSYGTPKQVAKDNNSITGRYLSGKDFISVPDEFRKGHPGKFLTLTGAKSNNLQNVSIKIPLGTFTCVSGVSGSGKSTLILHTLYRACIQKLERASVVPGKYDSLTGLEYIDKIIDIDQSPIGRTPRSNPVTYTGAFSHIRDWFVELPESKARGYKVGRFSFNVKGGRCEACQGDGTLKIEMHFLPDVYVKCDVCQGKRYNRETLEIKYKDKNISDVLDMNVDEACEFFNKVPSIYEKLIALKEVGLGYIKIGQSATTLSGGEAQRVKLAKELAKRSTGKTLYILDEPTTGLHAADVKKLLSVLHKLVDLNNTILVIEHNMDVIKTADYIIDVGPNGGDKGGKIVAEGNPFEIAKSKESLTGKYLKLYLDKAKKNQKKITIDTDA